jgi:hypothetical protein
VSAAPRLAPGTGFADGKISLVTLPTGLAVPDRQLRTADRQARDRAVLSLRIVAGLHTGSMRDLAKEAGVSVQSLSKATRRLAARLGLKLHLLSDQHRESLAEAQRRRWAKRKATS